MIGRSRDAVSRTALLVILLALGLCLGHPAVAQKRFTPVQEGALQAAAGVGAAVLTIPAMMAAGTAIGRSSSDLSAALVPGILLQAIVPPVAVTLAEWAVGRFALKNGSRFHPTIWLALGVNLVAIVLGSVAGVSTHDATAYSLFTIAQSLVLPAATTALMYATRRPEAKPQPTSSLLQVSF